MKSRLSFAALVILVCTSLKILAAEPSLTLARDKNFLVIRGPQIPGEEIRIHYLEAYCRAGSTDADWRAAGSLVSLGESETKRFTVASRSNMPVSIAC